MKSKDQTLLEEAYNQILLGEGIIPSFITDKVQGLVINIASQLKEQSPEEFDRIVTVIKTKNIGELKRLFQEYHIEEELKKSIKPIVQEGIVTGIKSAIDSFGRLMSKMTDVVMGKHGSTRALITIILIMILGVAQLWLLASGAGSGELAGLGLVELLTTTKLGILTNVCYFFIPFLVTRNVEIEKGMYRGR